MSTPYYEDEHVTLYHGDSFEVLSEVAAEPVGVLLTDPPYFKVKDDEWDNQWAKAHEFLSWMGGTYPTAPANSWKHPCEKPESMIRDMVTASSRPGDLILDPFAGSGTTLVVAKQERRRAIGVEIDERYCEIAAKRLSQDVLDFGVTA